GQRARAPRCRLPRARRGESRYDSVSRCGTVAVPGLDLFARTQRRSAGVIMSVTLRVVVVDDEEPARLVLREYLTGEDAVTVVAECANGFEAVKAVADHAPDLVITDIQMPKLDGFEVLDLIGRDTNVIFATAY